MLKDPGDIDRFVSDARVGDWATYGQGDHPPRDLVRAMRPYVDAGVLVPTSKREAAGMLYLVKRAKGVVPLSALDRQRSKARSWRQRGVADLGRVFQCLVRAARRGVPCPAYCEIARVCQLSREGARARVRQLVRTGKIASTYDEAAGWRVITVLVGPHAGRSTMALPVDHGKDAR